MGIVRAPAGVSNFCDVHAPPSFVMFCVEIWLRVECLVLPQTPLNAGHRLLAGRVASSPDCSGPGAERSRTPAIATSSRRVMTVIRRAPVEADDKRSQSTP